MIKYFILIILFFPEHAFANAIIPLHFILKPSVGFLLTFLTVVLIESLIFKFFKREKRILQHLKYISAGNLISSFVGTLIIFCLNNNEFSIYQMHWEYFYIFLITTILVETPVFRFLYEETNYQKLITTTLTAHLFSYGFLLFLPLLILQISIYESQREATERRNAWSNKDVLTNDLSIIFSKTTNNGQKTKLIEVTRNSHRELEVFKDNYVFDISGNFILARGSTYDKKLQLINWRKDRKLLDLEDRFSTRIYSSKDFGLIVYSQRADLQGNVDSNGWRNMYGVSYKMKPLSDKYDYLSKIKDVRFGGIYNFENDLIYSKHSQCKYDIAESKPNNRIERCDESPSSTIVRKQGTNYSFLASDATNPILINNTLFYLSRNKIFQLDLKKNIRQQIINEEIESFKVSQNMQFILAETVSHTVFGNSTFLVLISLKDDRRLIIDEGQILAFDFVE